MALTSGSAQIKDEILIGKVLAVGDGDTFYLRTNDGRELWKLCEARDASDDSEGKVRNETDSDNDKSDDGDERNESNENSGNDTGAEKEREG